MELVGITKALREVVVRELFCSFYYCYDIGKTSRTMRFLSESWKIGAKRDNQKRKQLCVPTIRHEMYTLTRNPHAIAPIQRVPNHGPIGNRNESFWELFWVGGERG